MAFVEKQSENGVRMDSLGKKINFLLRDLALWKKKVQQLLFSKKKNKQLKLSSGVSVFSISGQNLKNKKGSMIWGNYGLTRGKIGARPHEEA